VWSQGGAVGIETGYELGERTVRSSSSGRVKNYLYIVNTCSGAHSASLQWVPGAVISVIEWPGREDNHTSATTRVG
jgi:hypothetical protein